jgi:hypothetical protein
MTKRTHLQLQNHLLQLGAVLGTLLMRGVQSLLELSQPRLLTGRRLTQGLHPTTPQLQCVPAQVWRWCKTITHLQLML